MTFGIRRTSVLKFTFVDVLTLLSVALESVVAATEEGAGNVVTGSVEIAVVCAGTAFIDVYADLAITKETRFAGAVMCAKGVGADCIFGTRMIAEGTFVFRVAGIAAFGVVAHVFRLTLVLGCLTFINVLTVVSRSRITLGTLAIEGAFHVDAVVFVGTGMTASGTFVDIGTDMSVAFETIVTFAFKTACSVFAFGVGVTR